MKQLKKEAAGYMSPQKNLMNDQKQDCLTRFFAGSFNHCMFELRYALIILLALYGLVSAAIASQMGPLSKAEEMMPPDHPLVVT